MKENLHDVQEALVLILDSLKNNLGMLKIDYTSCDDLCYGTVGYIANLLMKNVPRSDAMFDTIASIMYESTEGRRQSFFIVNPNSKYSIAEVTLLADKKNENAKMHYWTESGRDAGNLSVGINKVMLGIEGNSYEILYVQPMNYYELDEYTEISILNIIYHEGFIYRGFYPVEKDRINYWHWAKDNETGIEIAASDYSRIFMADITPPPDLELMELDVFLMEIN